MKPLCILTLALTGTAFADHNWRIDEKEAIQKTFPVASGSGPHKLLVDVVAGYVHVTGRAGSEVRVTIDKHVLADYREAVEEAKRDVKLDMSQQGNFVRLYEEGPYRSGNGINYRGDDYYGYRVVWNCDIEVPTDTEVIVKTVNRGDIVIKKTTGDYDVHGLNGAIELEDVAGSGAVNILNGKMKVKYTSNPQKATKFHTLNGSIDVYFAKAPDADLQFKKLNGDIFTDFELTLRPSSGSSEGSNGRWVYRSNREIAARAGKGGPELSFETLNGTIRLHSK